ncbi:MAG TPA: antitoxin [Actinomycetes bacterium]|jgi:plasmid stability protein|nr:antitoxin [Actinomycetes bacterium]
MGKPLQIRDVPDDVLAALKAKAEREGLSLAAYALRVLARDAELPTIADVLAWPQEQVDLTGQQLADLIRDERPA